MDGLVVIELFGEEYRFKPDSQVEDPEQVAQHLKKHIKEAEVLFNRNPSDKNKIVILLLAGMNLSKDFHELKRKFSELENETEKKVSSILEKLNKGIEKDTAYKLL